MSIEPVELKYTKLADYYLQLLGGSKDRVTMTEIRPGIYSHFDVLPEEDACEYFDLNFQPIPFDYLDMFANWFQVTWQRIRDGEDVMKCDIPGKDGGNIDCWKDPFKLSTFAKEGMGLSYMVLPMELLRRRMIHYAHGFDKYSAPVDHIYRKTEIPLSEVKLHRTAFHVVCVADVEPTEENLKLFQAEHGTKLCTQFQDFTCSYVVRDNEVYYRPLGKDYYVRVKEAYKQYYKPRPILQVLDTLTGLVYTPTGNLLLKLDKRTFKRWIDRSIDGYFFIMIPPRPHVPVDEMFFVVMTYFPHDKNPMEAGPIR